MNNRSIAKLTIDHSNGFDSAQASLTTSGFLPFVLSKVEGYEQLWKRSNVKSFYKQKKVLVTGGAGFIGSHVVDALDQLEAEVTVLDNLSTGLLSNIATKQYTFIHGDIRDYKTCLAACEDKNVVFHLAAMASVGQADENPIACHTNNVIGTLNLLQASKMRNVQQFIFSSSAAVYGNKQTINKETDCCQPASHYGLSKLAAEQYCQLYAQQGLATLCLRYFNVFGSRQKSSYAGVVTQITAALQEDKPITLYGNGKQMRDFISVDQIVHYNLAAALLEQSFLNGQAVNIASGTSITLLTLVEQLEKQYNKKATIQFAPARQGDILISKADCSKKELLFS